MSAEAMGALAGLVMVVAVAVLGIMLNAGPRR